MSRTVDGETRGLHPATNLQPPNIPDLPTVPWVTLIWSVGMALGLALLVGSHPGDSRPLALATPVPAPTVAVVETQLQELAARVEQLEAEVAELRTPRVALED